MTRVSYVDASALVKLVLHEAETDALTHDLDGRDLCTSQVGRIEFERGVRRVRDDAEGEIAMVLDRVEVLAMHVAIEGAAGALRPPTLRSLDAIHLATMLAVREDIDAAYIYDDRLADAARAHGFDVRAPA